LLHIQFQDTEWLANKNVLALLAHAKIRLHYCWSFFNWHYV